MKGRATVEKFNELSMAMCEPDITDEQMEELSAGDEQTAVFTRIFGYPSGIRPPLHHGYRSSTSQ